MAINTVSVVGPRAEAQKQEKEKKDPLDLILQGLQIAQGVTGIAVNYQTIQQKMAEREQIADSRAGYHPDKMRAEMHEKGFSEAAPGTPGAQDYTFRQGEGDEGLKKLTLMPPQQKQSSPLIETIQNFKDEKSGKVGTALVDKTTGEVKGFVPQEPKASEGGTYGNLTPDKDGNLWTINNKTGKAEKVDTDGATFGKGGKGGGSGKPVSGEVAQNIGKYDAAMTQIASLEKDWKGKTGFFSGVAQYVPGTDAAQYVDAQKLAAQDIGQIVEGGKLTDSDFERYLEMMPTAGDSEERAGEKFERLKNYIAERKKTSIEGATQAGLNTSGFKEAVKPPALLNQKPGAGTAIGAPATKSVEEMSNEELKAYIEANKKK